MRFIVRFMDREFWCLAETEAEGETIDEVIVNATLYVKHQIDAYKIVQVQIQRVPK